jgi:hypothetical protein
VAQITHSTPVTNAANFLLPFSAQKSHVKPQTHLTHYPATTSEWHFSYAQSHIIKLEIKKNPGLSRGFPLKKGKSAITRLFGKIKP